MSNALPIRVVRIIDARTSAHFFVSVAVHRDCPVEVLARVETQWADARREVEMATDDGLEHAHWDWRNKQSSVASGHHRLVAMECEGEIQGMMAVLREPRPSRLGDQAVLYVDFLEVAPWNLRSISGRRFSGIGAWLIVEAIRMSVDAGSGGRVGLHSLPQAEQFYKQCGMTRVGFDPNYHRLSYFEYTEIEAADRLMQFGG